jgi:hypothetical protein
MLLIPVEILNNSLGAGLLGVILSAMYVSDSHTLTMGSDNFVRVYGITCVQTFEPSNRYYQIYSLFLCSGSITARPIQRITFM